MHALLMLCVQRDTLKVYEFGDDMKIFGPVQQTKIPFDYPGSVPTLSTNNGEDAVLWEVRVVLCGIPPGIPPGRCMYGSPRA